MGVFPDWQFAGAAGGSFPHARGGVSAITTRGLREVSFSPRPWGCFYIKTMDAGLSYVFPTPVGVFPLGGGCQAISRSFPHARGGVSMSTAWYGVMFAFSPRPWGCFFRYNGVTDTKMVFPTPVGVFLHGAENAGVSISFPHARGGVSATVSIYGFKAMFSPRPWGCFYQKRRLKQKRKVFPTPVGVFPHRCGVRGDVLGFPHARGGVSKTFEVISF